MTRSRAFALSLVTAAALAPTALAQRGKAVLSWDADEVVIEHGKPPVGKHGLDELPPGGDWRLGSNNATTMDTGLAILAGRSMVAPGSYRLKLYRDRDGEKFALRIDYGGWPIQADGQSAFMPAETLAEEKAATKTLAIEWRDAANKPLDKRRRRKNDKAPNTIASVQIRFGPYRLDVPVTVLGTRKAGKIRGWTFHYHTVPADVFEQRLEAEQGIVIGTLRPSKAQRKPSIPPFFNVVAWKDRIRIIPALRAPTEFFGFAELKPFDAAWTTEREVAWTDANEEQPFLRVTDVTLHKGRLLLEISCGKRTSSVSLEVPQQPKR